MSRSNPSQNQTNPAVRFFEWNGEHGLVRYYDKDAKKNVDVALPFTFLLLDELASVRGWHDPSQSGIYSNEVRDTRTEIIVVKAFKEGVLAEGLYKDIKDRVNASGGSYNATCYIAFKHDGALAIGSLRFKGAALGEWMEFRKSHRADLYKKAITIADYVEGKKGKVVFRVPAFETKVTSSETDAIAVDLDRQLQTFLEAYLSRKTEDRAEDRAADPTDFPVDEHDRDEHDLEPMNPADIPSDDDIPF